MCGIIAVIAKNGDVEMARETMLNQYQSQFGRGQRGFGLIEILQKGNVRVRRATEPIKATVDITRSESGILLFHHRMPTSTDNTMQQTHPILVSHEELSGDWYICHNGVIRNTRELKEKHEKLGYKYTTLTKARHSSTFLEFNDSEAMAIELVRVLEGKQESAQWQGAAAFIGIKVNKKTGKAMQVMYGKGEGNPLHFKETKDYLMFASDIPGEGVYDVPEKSFGLLTMKAIETPSLWPLDEKKERSLYEMSLVSDLSLMPLETPTVPIRSMPHNPTASHGYPGFQTGPGQGRGNTTKPLGLLAPGRTAGGKDDDKDYGHAVIRIPGKEATSGPNEDESPRAKAFNVMADRVTEKVANVINTMFSYLSEIDLDDKEVHGYMAEIEAIIRDRMKSAPRARYHLDKMEDNYNTLDMQNEHMKSLQKEEVIAG